MSLRNERWGIIVNPYSGKRQLKKDWTNIYYLLKRAEINFSEQLTAYAGHAVEIAKNMVEAGFRYLLVVGGDGTLNEVVNGIYTSSISDKSAVTLALIPYGTGNDWARYWGISRKYAKLKDLLFQRKSTLIDIGKITYQSNDNQPITRYFINASGIGFDGTVVRITNKLKQFLGGSAWVYSLAVFLTIFKLKVHKMRLTGDDKSIERSFFTLAIGNGCYSGGGLKQVPDANPTDGLLHITALEGPKLSQIPSAIKLLFSGRLPEHVCAHSFVTKRFDMEFDKKIHAETDGVEITVKAPATIEIVPQALRMIIP